VGWVPAWAGTPRRRGPRYDTAGRVTGGNEGSARHPTKRLPNEKRSRWFPTGSASGFRPGSFDPGRFPIRLPLEQAPVLARSGSRRSKLRQVPLDIARQARRASVRTIAKQARRSSFAKPPPESIGIAGLRRKWVRHRVSPLPRASSPAAPPRLFRFRSRRTSAASALAALRKLRPFPGGAPDRES
jgi:hypothetical protein